MKRPGIVILCCLVAWLPSCLLGCKSTHRLDIYLHILPARNGEEIVLMETANDSKRLEDIPGDDRPRTLGDLLEPGVDQ